MPFTAFSDRHLQSKVHVGRKTMQCPNCHQENDPSNRICIKCGSLLVPEKIDASTQQPIGPVDSIYFQSEARRLRQDLEVINSRLSSLENLLEQRSAAGKSPGEPPPPKPVVPQPAATILPGAFPEEKVTPPAPQPVLSGIAAPFPPAPAPALSGASLQPPISPAPVSKSARNREWEQILGGNWLARIGILAVIIGAAFFLKFAFDNNWLGPGARVILGVAAGLVLLGLGYYWNKRYAVFAQALSGGGIALLYLCIFAAFAVFDLLGFYWAVAFLVLISAGSTLLALRYNSVAMAVIGILGAFCAPFILGASGWFAAASVSEGNGIQLLIYVIAVDIGVLALSTFRNWRWFTLLALVASLISFAIWYDRYGQIASLLTAELSLTVLFLIFVGTTILYLLIWRRRAEAQDYSLMLINAVTYFSISLALMWHDLRGWMGGFSLLVDLFYGLLAYYALKRGEEHQRLGFFALGISLIFLTVTMPVQFGDKAWTTVAWAAEGTVLIWLSLRLRIFYFRYCGYLALVAMAFRLLFLDSWLDFRHFQPVFNERVLAFIFGIAAVYLTGYLLRKQGPKLYPVFLIASNVLALWIAAVESLQYILSRPVNDSGIFTLTFLIVAAIWVAYQPMLWRRPARLFENILLVVNAAFFLLLSIPFWWEFREWMGLIYFILFCIYGLQAYLLHKDHLFDWSGGVITGISIVFITLLAPAQFGNHACATIFWSAELIALSWLSFAWRLPQLRIYSFIMFALVSVRLLFFDTFNVLPSGFQSWSTFQPVLNERVLAFLCGIAAIYLTVYVYWRFRQEYPEWKTPASTFLIAASLFTVWLISFEVWNYFDLQIGTSPHGAAVNSLESAQKLSLTVVWALYAVVVLAAGIWRHSRTARSCALCLLALAVIKVFVYDVFALEQVYRIIAFTGLGVLLIVCGYLYHRYSRAIKGFLVNKD